MGYLVRLCPPGLLARFLSRIHQAPSPRSNIGFVRPGIVVAPWQTTLVSTRGNTIFPLLGIGVTHDVMNGFHLGALWHPSPSISPPTRLSKSPTVNNSTIQWCRHYLHPSTLQGLRYSDSPRRRVPRPATSQPPTNSISKSIAVSRGLSPPLTPLLPPSCRGPEEAPVDRTPCEKRLIAPLASQDVDILPFLRVACSVSTRQKRTNEEKYSFASRGKLKRESDPDLLSDQIRREGPKKEPVPCSLQLACSPTSHPIPPNPIGDGGVVGVVVN